MLLCLLVAALVEGIGVSTLLPLLSIALGDEAGAERSPYEDGVRDVLARFDLEPTLPALLVIVVVAFWIKALLVLLSRRQVGYTVAHVATDFFNDTATTEIYTL
jgi:ATP-binding cassette subfamily C protein